MKFKTTQREIRNNYNVIIRVPYCGLQNLLEYKNPVAYTVRREGWAADVYEVFVSVAIVTGYAPFGNFMPSFDLLSEYENKAEKIFLNSTTEDNEKALDGLLREFVDDVIKSAKQ